MASAILLTNANGNPVTLENPDTNTETRTIDVSTLGAQIGVGQTWQDVTASRSNGVTYTNNTSLPIMFLISVGASDINYQLLVDGSIVTEHDGSGNPSPSQAGVIVPAGSTYSIANLSNLVRWSELR